MTLLPLTARFAEIELAGGNLQACGWYSYIRGEQGKA
jgi:hypothetical protein